MARQFRTDDTSVWNERFGAGSDGPLTISGNTNDATPNTNIGYHALGVTSLSVGSGTGFADGNLILIHQSRETGAGLWELNKISSGGGTTTLGLAYATVNEYNTQAQVYKLFQYSSANIAGGVTLTGSAWDGSKGGILALLANGTVTIAGSIVGTGTGFRGGPTHVFSDQSFYYSGEGTVGIYGDHRTANGNGGGSGKHKQGRVGGGGGGGNGTDGTDGAATNEGGDNGYKGVASGAANLTTMTFGGGGGASGHTTNFGDNQVAGSNGGGIVLIIAKTIIVTGSIVVTGVNGINNTGHADRAGSGAGASGSVLLKGQTLTLGSNLITGAATTGGLAGVDGGAGGAGSVGRIHADYSQSLSGTTSPTIDPSLDTVLNDLPSNQNYTFLM